MWSGLDVQASLVLQGFSSRLMVFSDYVSDSVIPRIALDADIQGPFVIVLILQFLWFSCNDLFPQSISSYTIDWWSLWHSLPCSFPPFEAY